MFCSCFFRKKRKYDHVIGLGHNCEISFQFFCSYKFLDSHLFSWVKISDPEKFLECLKNTDLIFSEGVSLGSPNYVCNKFKFGFHGKAKPEDLLGKDGTPDQKLVERDIDELKERIAYLKEKYKKTINAEGTKLFIVKEPASEDFVKRLANVLGEKVKREFDLLIIVDKKNFLRYKNLEKGNIFIRKVRNFNPIDAATRKKTADMKGWKRIFKEFRPQKVLTQSKKYKFEELN